MKSLLFYRVGSFRKGGIHYSPEDLNVIKNIMNYLEGGLSVVRIEKLPYNEVVITVGNAKGKHHLSKLMEVSSSDKVALRFEDITDYSPFLYESVKPFVSIPLYSSSPIPTEPTYFSPKYHDNAFVVTNDQLELGLDRLKCEYFLKVPRI